MTNFSMNEGSTTYWTAIFLLLCNSNRCQPDHIAATLVARSNLDGDADTAGNKNIANVSRWLNDWNKVMRR